MRAAPKLRLRWDWNRQVWRGGRKFTNFVKPCIRCGDEFLGIRSSRYCWSCRHLRYVALRAESSAAQAAVARARRHGELVPPSDLDCVDCGKKAEVYDHRDYSRPLDVQPVCRGCNGRRGRGRRLKFDRDPIWSAPTHGEARA